jgi:hypothetical protein
MAIQLARLERVIVRRNTATMTTPHRDRLAIRTAVGAVVRSLLIGLGVGVTLMQGHPDGVVSIATVGVLAIGVALVSWDT